jgi:hypothetical protein
MLLKRRQLQILRQLRSTEIISEKYRVVRGWTYTSSFQKDNKSNNTVLPELHVPDIRCLVTSTQISDNLSIIAQYQTCQSCTASGSNL